MERAVLLEILTLTMYYETIGSESILVYMLTDAQGLI